MCKMNFFPTAIAPAIPDEWTSDSICRLRRSSRLLSLKSVTRSKPGLISKDQQSDLDRSLRRTARVTLSLDWDADNNDASVHVPLEKILVEDGVLEDISRRTAETEADTAQDANNADHDPPEEEAVTVVETESDSSDDEEAWGRSGSVVRFGTIEIREYPRILGDNPSVSSGPPVALSWSHDLSTVVALSVDEYEWSRFPSRRRKDQMLVPAYVREDWLLEAGHSRGQIEEATKRVEKERARRHRSASEGKTRQRACEIGESLRRFTRLPSLSRK